MKKALITGITGQDGAYLAEFLLDKGYEVHGIKRRASSFNTDRIDHLYQDPHEKGRRLFLHYGDLTDATNLIRIVQEVQPDELYNLAAQSHVAVSFETRKLCFLGSSCIYRRLAPQPMREEHLLTGPLEPTNESYAIAKIAGIKMCQAYRLQHGFNAISLMPTNLYGPGDNFEVANAHVLPALMRRCHEARERAATELVVWGTGTPRREFLHADDLAAAAIFMMQHYESGDIVNIGTGTDISIAELAALIKTVTGFKGTLRFDPSRPDGSPRKLLDVSRARSLGWQASICLEDGVRRTYDWFRQAAETARL